jgi:hypothetical protein
MKNQQQNQEDGNNNDDSSSSSSWNNAQVIRALNNLIEYTKNDQKCLQDPTHLSHYRIIPNDIEKAYTLLDTGAQMIYNTATKYTLVGKISMKDQMKLGTDLLRGCELIGASLQTIVTDSTGCSRSVRHLTQRSCLSIFINVLHLVECFEDGTALSLEQINNNVGAQRTGAVWESCDHVLKKLLPKGNRNAIRRELFTWTRECQDTMEEFQELVDLGPKLSARVEEDPDFEEGEEDDYFGSDDQEDQYCETELPIAQACLGVLKNSRGNMKIALETCEILGEKVHSNDSTEHQRYLDDIQKIYEYARNVGEGVTDFGSLLYPPILNTDLTGPVRKQVGYIMQLQDYILGLDCLPSNISEFANILRTASETRENEFLSAWQTAQER